MRNHSSTGTIEVENVSKRYRLGTLGTLRGAVSALFSRNNDRNDRRRTLWALRDVSFRLEAGQSLGLIGPNGAGKTTTLKLLSNITQPTAGRIAVHGRVSSLIELGAGFHPELTGRENVYLNGAILGLKRSEVSRKMDDIVAFSGLERFIDTPVKRYSSGMYVRLGFAVAAHVEPDVLLVDEVLAVGDASFRHRCIQHMRQLQRNGTTVLFVSHNMHLVRRMCDSALLLLEGQIRARGTPSTIISEYEKLLLSDSPAASPTGEGEVSTSDLQGNLILTAVEISSNTGVTDDGLISRLPAQVKIEYKTTSVQRIGRIDIRILRDDSTLCSTADSSLSASAELHEISGNGIIEATYTPLQLTTGSYIAVVQITDISDSLVIASAQSEPFYVHADSADRDRGIYVPDVTWSKRDLAG